MGAADVVTCQHELLRGDADRAANFCPLPAALPVRSCAPMRCLSDD